MKFLGRVDYEDLLRGSRIFGCGGGGDPDKAQQRLKEIGKSALRLVTLDELEGDSRLFTAFMIGSSGSTEEEPRLLWKAKNELERIVGRLDAVIPVEIGPGALFEALSFAVKFDLPVVDADMVGGRSSPELYLETISLAKKKRAPLVLVNGENDMIIVKEVEKEERMETLCRLLARHSGGYLYAVGYPLTVSDVKDILVQKTLSTAIELGKSVKDGEIREFFERHGGKEIFEGVVAEVVKEDSQGFLTGTFTVQGTGRWAGSTLAAWFKNELMIAWVDGKPSATCPDTICLTDLHYNGLYNRDVRSGESVKAIAFAAAPLWRSQQGLQIFNPRVFGFNIDYKPIGKGQI